MTPPPAISLPLGARDILPAEAVRISEVEKSISGLFKSYGFSRVATPLVEYVDVLSLGLDDYLKDKVLKFIDQNTGRVVGIRPDITPQIARLTATRMKDAPRPLKLCYTESVVRCQTPNGGNASETLQIGAEYISVTASPEIDAEMIVMAVESLKAIGLTGFRIDIGDVGFVKSILDRLSVGPEARGSIKEAISRKDTAGLRGLLKGLFEKVTDEDAELLCALTTFYGEKEILKKAATFAGADRGVIANLEKIIEFITEKGYQDYVTIDLGEVRGFDYYTGPIIEGFAAGLGKPILYGGRYDDLAARYGKPSASSGFAFDVARLLAAQDTSNQ